MDGLSLAIGAFVILFALMMLRVPVGIAMVLVGVGGFAVLTDFGPALSLLELTPIRTLTDFTFGLVPLFVLMGALANASGMSRDLFRASNAWLGHRRGGLALSTVAACGGFAAICGSSVATAATMSKVALPEMRRYGYADSLATGTIAAGGTLGILIPPSIVLAVYGIITETDIGRLFVAGLVPGLLAVLMYMAAVQGVAVVRPEWVPAGERSDWRTRFASLRTVWPILVVFAFVIGGIYGGVFTPTEAAAMGAAAVGLIAFAIGRMSIGRLLGCLREALITTGALFIVLIGAILFSRFLTITQFPQQVAETLLSLDLGRYGTLALIILFYVILGCFMEAMAIILLTVPVFFPSIVGLGFDPIWFGVIVVMVTELGLITPPFGLNVFVIKGEAPGVPLKSIYAGVTPYIASDLVRLVILIAFPIIVLWLPNQM